MPTILSRGARGTVAPRDALQRRATPVTARAAGGDDAARLVVHRDLVDDRVGHQISSATLMEAVPACAANASPIRSRLNRCVMSGAVRTAPLSTSLSASGNSSWEIIEPVIVTSRRTA